MNTQEYSEYSEYSEIINEIMGDPQFMNKIKSSIDSIVKDSVIDYSDIPDIIFIINEVLTKSKKGINDSVLIKKILEVLLERTGLVIENRDSFNKLVDGSIKLLFLKNKSFCCFT